MTDVNPPTEKFCPVCLESSAEGTQEWTTWDCGHSLHTSCALQSALRGSVTCAMCREPVVEDVDEVENAREDALFRVHQHRRRVCLQRALRMRPTDRPGPLQRAIGAYERAKHRLALAKEARTVKLSEARARNRALRTSGFRVRLSHTVTAKIHRAEDDVERTKQRVEDEMMIFQMNPN